MAEGLKSVMDVGAGRLPVLTEELLADVGGGTVVSPQCD